VPLPPSGLLLDPAPACVIAAALAALFATAAWHKARALAEFGAVLSAYRVLPDGLARALAPVVPVAEAALAGALVAAVAWPAARPFAAFGSAALLAAYAAAIGLNLARGRRELDCGCSGPGQRRPIAGWMIVRNVLLGLGALALALPWAPRPLGMLDAPTVLAGVACCALLYGAIDLLYGRILPRTAQLRGSEAR
jgi:hypothetical protein